MVVAADPRAVEAGLAVLREGGSAVDAAIAAQLVLSVVEPQSSGLGGGFLVHYDAASRTVTTYDRRKPRAAAATPDLFLNADGTAMDFMNAVVSGRSVGVPGLIDMLDLAHQTSAGWSGTACSSRRSNWRSPASRCRRAWLNPSPRTSAWMPTGLPPRCS
ncbi:MAG: hypothetical protein FJX36_04860 [Alphaproteobacteria bacterium]|nr:hypothetical protein [Alphaproteobacteria bacterium]